MKKFSFSDLNLSVAATGGNLHGENIAAAPPTPSGGGSPAWRRALKRQFLVFSLPPEMPEAPVSLTVAAKHGDKTRCVKI